MEAQSFDRMLDKVGRDMLESAVKGTIKVTSITCRNCGSTTIWRYGKNRSGVQRFVCTNCGKVFIDKDALPRMRTPVKEVGDVMGEYYGGMSYGELRRQFDQQHNERLSRSSFHRWLTKFSKIAVDEANKYHPKVGDTWLADECVLKIGGKNVWCWDIIDGDTRFLLATHLSPTRTTKDAQELMEKAYKAAGKAPKVILTDKLAAYIDGIELTFGADTKHIQSKPFTTADMSTNKIERWHSTLRAREGIMRGLKSPPTAQALLDGWLVHYNYFRPHESLGDRTPAQAAGVSFPYKSWLDIIERQRPSKVETEPVTEIEPLVKKIEDWGHPSYKAQARRKLKRFKRRNGDLPTAIGGLR